MSEPDCPPGARLIPLSHGQFAVVDEENYDELSQYKWNAMTGRYTYYAYRSRSRRLEGPGTALMHRQIVGPPPGLQVDHINGNGLDNRSENLRVVTNTQNQLNRKRPRHNTSGFIGVTRNGKRWTARVRVNGVLTHVGVFDTAEEAARARDEAAIQNYGEFARLNFPEREAE